MREKNPQSPIPNLQSDIPYWVYYPQLGINIPNWGFGLLVL